MSLKANIKAPDFVLPDQNGEKHKLSDYKGKWVLLYFYPKDDTSGCTKEACMIRDELPNFKKLKAVVLGVSVDSVTSHKKFADKYDLPFTLLSDEGDPDAPTLAVGGRRADRKRRLKVVKMYKVWGKKMMYGREYFGTLRTSYLIDPEGKIAKVYEKVKPEIHAEEVIVDLKTLKK